MNYKNIKMKINAEESSNSFEVKVSTDTAMIEEDITFYDRASKSYKVDTETADSLINVALSALNFNGASDVEAAHYIISLFLHDYEKQELVEKLEEEII